MTKRDGSHSQHAGRLVCRDDEPHRLEHLGGQVEVDSVCVGVRKATNHVIVTEANNKGELDSIAKHKFAYSVWAVRSHIPEDIPILPVYLRVVEQQDLLEFNVAERALEDGRRGTPSLHCVSVVRHLRLRFRKPRS